MQLPLISTSDQDLSLLMTKWKSVIDVMLSGPLVNSSLLENITLTSGVNTINHFLGRRLLGYIVVMNSANVTYYDNQSTNPTRNKTLVLVASGASTISLLVF